MTTVKLMGENIHLAGSFPNSGDLAADFELFSSELKPISLKQFGGRRKLISIVPSIDTQVCAMSSRRLNEMAEQHPQYAFMVVSADLPFAMARFKKVEKLKHIELLSIFRSSDFAQQYGVLMTDGVLQGLTARALLVLDDANRVCYTELVDDIAHEPDYDAALSALKS